jgi:hypothetical protein
MHDVKLRLCVVVFSILGVMLAGCAGETEPADEGSAPPPVVSSTDLSPKAEPDQLLGAQHVTALQQALIDAAAAAAAAGK